ncbi:hypothetical protein NG895_24740 [Aeoliella sp. ICT_H6.2]|uniref:Carboxypeptidase regulatory-like domain-containing protein n=1 Tax=Aeoliella straminimaris TaxID=2954799 RepID=A0A9X2FF76_9BACT|nr:hypothetical protein [Aeoliella straminimaris]MCO6047118.1 hypothetical protein [Aeoliella straminimaris]
MSKPTRILYGLLGPSLLVIAGCGASDEYAPVSGQVFYKGQPLNTGVVMFQPASGPIARGRIQSDGTFQLETLGEAPGARIGENKVRISARQAPADPNAAEVGLGKLLIPRRYTDFSTSGLTIEVEPDRTEPYVFRLTD